MAVLGNSRHELVAQLLAAGKSAEDASALAGFDTLKSSWQSNARKRAGREDIKARVRELQGESADKATDISAEAIHQVLWRIASTHLDDEDIDTSHVIAAAREIGKMLGFYAPDKVEASGNLTIEIVKFAPDDDPPAA